MKTLEYIGVHVGDVGYFDQSCLDHMIVIIRQGVAELKSSGCEITRIELAQHLGMDRQRISRLCKTLGIIEIFE